MSQLDRKFTAWCAERPGRMVWWCPKTLRFKRYDPPYNKPAKETT